MKKSRRTQKVKKLLAHMAHKGSDAAVTDRSPGRVGGTRHVQPSEQAVRPQAACTKRNIYIKARRLSRRPDVTRTSCKVLVQTKQTSASNAKEPTLSTATSARSALTYMSWHGQAYENWPQQKRQNI